MRSRDNVRYKPHVLLAGGNHHLVNVHHRHKLWLLLQQLVQQGAVAAAQDENLLVLEKCELSIFPVDGRLLIAPCSSACRDT